MRLTSRNTVVAWVLVLSLALVVRLALVAITLEYEPTNDPADYVRHALSIANGSGYPPSNVSPGGGPTAIRPPAYPFFLGGVFALPGGGVTAARLLQAVLGTVAVALIGLVGRQLWGSASGLAAAGLAAVMPSLILVGSALLSEALFVPLMVGSLAAVLAHRRSPHQYRWAVLAGLLAGLATLTRSNAAVLVIPLVAGLYVRRPAPRLRELTPALALVAAAALAILPWTIRNAVELKAFVPVSTQGSYTLAGTYNEVSRSDERFPAAWRPASFSPEYAALIRGGPSGEAALGAELASAVLDDIRRHPLYVVEVGFWNTVRLFHLGQLAYSYSSAASVGIPRSLAKAAVIGFYALALLAVAGLFTRRVRETPRFVWVLPLLLLAVVFVTALTRLRAPIDVFLILIAGAALSCALERSRARARRA